jgi:hypothetical protein
MSLRSRLTLYYTSLVGGILLLLGVAVYISVSLTVTRQLDSALRRSAELVISGATMDKSGRNRSSRFHAGLPTDVYVQAAAICFYRCLPMPWYRKALDPVGMQAMLPVYRDATVGKNRLRVLTVPLVIGSRPLVPYSWHQRRWSRRRHAADRLACRYAGCH